MLTKSDVVKQILAGKGGRAKECGKADAPANIALCKYWGKRDEELNLPVTSSLSLTLDTMGAHTEVAFCEGEDRIHLAGERLPVDHPFAERLSRYLDLFRQPGQGFIVNTESRVPVAAGLASSASGFAAMAKALDDLFGWELSGRELSILSRLGSGSACRSLYSGLVEWHAGSREDGMDSFAEPVGVEWPELRLGWILVSSAAKPVGSREAMRRTRETSVFYRSWPAQVERDLAAIRSALFAGDFAALGEAVEGNALAMHATMMGAHPPVLYWLSGTVDVLQRVWEARRQGLAVYATMDAGPNVKLLYLDPDESDVRGCFPEMFARLQGGGGAQG